MIFKFHNNFQRSWNYGYKVHPTICILCTDAYELHPTNFAKKYTAMDYRYFGPPTFWFVDVLGCRRFGLSTFWSVDVLVCRRFGLSTFWFVDVSVCRRFGLSTFQSVDVLVCRRFGLSTFRFVDVLVVDVSVCRRFDQLPYTWSAWGWLLWCYKTTLYVIRYTQWVNNYQHIEVVYRSFYVFSKDCCFTFLYLFRISSGRR